MLNDYQAAIETAALFDLSDHGKIELAGRDARSFLHNLCTQDVKNLPVGGDCEAFLTTNKARVIAHVWITQRESDVLLLDMVAGQAEKVYQHLNHYLISEQVELADRTKELGLLRLIGPKAAELLASLAITPSRRHRLLAVEGFDLFYPVAEVAAALRRSSLSKPAQVLGEPRGRTRFCASRRACRSTAATSTRIAWRWKSGELRKRFAIRRAAISARKRSSWRATGARSIAC